MGSSTDKTTSKGRSKQVPKGVPLLKHAGDDTSSSFGAIFQCSRCRIAVQSTHGNTVDGSDTQELLICLTETGSQFQDDEEN